MKSSTYRITRSAASLKTKPNPRQGSTVSLEKKILNPNQGVEGQDYSKVPPMVRKKEGMAIVCSFVVVVLRC